jgi:hypothetical protein
MNHYLGKINIGNPKERYGTAGIHESRAGIEP